MGSLKDDAQVTAGALVNCAEMPGCVCSAAESEGCQHGCCLPRQCSRAAPMLSRRIFKPNRLNKTKMLMNNQEASLKNK